MHTLRRSEKDSILVHVRMFTDEIISFYASFKVVPNLSFLTFP